MRTTPRASLAIAAAPEQLPVFAHALPIEGGREHQLDGRGCWCGPVGGYQLPDGTPLLRHRAPPPPRPPEPEPEERTVSRPTHDLGVASFVWRAGSSGIAHAHSGPKVYRTRTACGVAPVLEQLAWPTRAKCRQCLDLLGLLWA